MNNQPAFDLGKALAEARPPDAPEPRMTLAEQGEAHVTKIIAEKPNKFTVGGVTDGYGGAVDVTYDRKLSNGLGLTAYIKAWWNDASVTPHRTSGVRVGGQGSYTFGDR